MNATKQKKRITGTIALITIIAGSIATAQGAVSVLDYYRLGDSDPAAVAGNVGNTNTVDSVGSNDLTISGTPSYSSDVPFSDISGVSNSLSMSFDGSSQYSFSSRLTDAQDNFGIELFVKANSTAGSSGIVYNGKFGSSGFGLVRNGSIFQAVLGTNPGTIFGSSTVDIGEWVHLALVRDNGVSTFYVNGIANATSLATPLFGSNPFRIGSGAGSDHFIGLIDEVRIFTFTSGEFTTGDLLINQIPEPATAGIILGSLALLCTMARRQRR